MQKYELSKMKKNKEAEFNQKVIRKLITKKMLWH